MEIRTTVSMVRIHRGVPGMVFEPVVDSGYYVLLLIVIAMVLCNTVVSTYSSSRHDVRSDSSHGRGCTVFAFSEATFF